MPHKSHDDLDGFEYSAANQTWIIDPYVLIYSAARAIINNYQNAVLNNFGVVYSAGSWGLYFTGADSKIVNQEDALIKAASNAIFTGSGGSNINIKNSGAVISTADDGILLYLQADNAVINNTETGLIQGLGGITCVGAGATIGNAGRIVGLLGRGVSFTSPSNHDLQLENTGEIFGKTEGVGNHSNNGGTFTNLGRIHSDKYGIEVATATGLTTKIANLAGGVIQGSDAAIHVSAGQISLANHGKIVGDIRSPSPDGKDTVSNDGKINGDISLGLGRDVVVFAGGSQGTVFGGGGKDKFVFKREFVPAKDAASIGDFTPATDSIELSRKLFKDTGDTGTLKSKYFHVGSQAGDGSDRIVYDSDNGHLSYDRDGTGSGQAVLFAKLSANLDLHASDFTVIA